MPEVEFEPIRRGAPHVETIDLGRSGRLLLSIPLSRVPDARWTHLFGLAVGVDAAIGVEPPAIADQTVLLETTEQDVGRALRVLDDRIEAANRGYGLTRSVDLTSEEPPPAVAAEDAGDQLSVLDRLLGVESD